MAIACGREEGQEAWIAAWGRPSLPQRGPAGLGRQMGTSGLGGMGEGLWDSLLQGGPGRCGCHSPGGYLSFEGDMQRNGREEPRGGQEGAQRPVGRCLQAGAIWPLRGAGGLDGWQWVLGAAWTPAGSVPAGSPGPDPQACCRTGLGGRGGRGRRGPSLSGPGRCGPGTVMPVSRPAPLSGHCRPVPSQGVEGWKCEAEDPRRVQK